MIHKIHNARILAAGNTLHWAEDARDIAVDPTDDFGFRAGFGACARRSLWACCASTEILGRVPGNLDAQQFDGGPASKIDVGKAAAGARGRERIERIAPKGCGCDAASLRGRGGV